MKAPGITLHSPFIHAAAVTVSCLTSVGIVFPMAARADDLDSVCRASMPGLVSDTTLPDKPFYFFRAFPISNKIAYSAMMPNSPAGNDNYGENFILDLNTGKKQRIPGSVDAVPTPDEKWILTPMGSGGPLQFYRNDSGLSKDSQPAYMDGELSGAYQSVGTLPSTDPKMTVYRILIQNPTAGLKMKDVSATSNTVTGIGRAKSVCGNIKDSLKLPILSKDGSRISVFDEDGKPASTRIYKIDPATFNCELEHDFGFGTGKVDFSYDGNQVAFHAFGMKESGKWMRYPDSGVMGNSYVMDLKTKEIKKITQYTDTNALYPAFTKKGEIAVRMSDGEKTRVLKIDPRVDPVKMSSANFASDGTCKNPTPENDRILALGSLFQFLCLNNAEGVFAYRAPSHFLTLDQASCKKLAALWEANKNALASKANKNDAALYQRLATLSATDILSACPSESRMGDSVRLKAADLSGLKAGPEEMAAVANKNCLSCHNSDTGKKLAFMEPVSQYFTSVQNGSVTPAMTKDFESKLSKSLFAPSRTNKSKLLIDEMIERVSRGDVPPFPKPPLVPRETQTLVRYLENLRKSH